jgi:phospholipase/lecithinase/hemolysin
MILVARLRQTRRLHNHQRPTVSSWPLALALLTLLVARSASAAALRIAVIGDSLSAEYDALPSIPGVEDPTAYAAVTVPGWESRCWVEVLGLLRTNAVDLGPYRRTLPGWNDLRFTGYKYNFAIPGFEASQFAEIVNSSWFSNPQYLPYRLTLSDILSHESDACVVWIGANEFRANYGFLYDGGDPASLVGNLKRDVSDILDFVLAQSRALRVVVVNLPDLGATPTKQAAHPDPVKRQRVSQATMLANQAISELAATRGVPVADVFAATRQLIEGQQIWFGPVDIHSASDANNNPRYAFTCDGLHPNTALQMVIARIIIAVFNEYHRTGIPTITDREALNLLDIDPQQPYRDWASDHALVASGMGDDPDQDGVVNLVECVFDLDPLIRSASPLAIAASATGIQLNYRPDQGRSRLASVTPQWSYDLTNWTDVPIGSLTTAADGRVTVQFPKGGGASFLRLQVAIRRVE